MSQHRSQEEMTPLFVDLDGTVIKSDLLLESFLALLRLNPLYAFLAVGWLFRGKACLKEEIASRIKLDVARLPYHGRFLEFLKSEGEKGRRIVLATACNERLARQVADHLGIFQGILASDGRRNLSAERKLRAVLDECGPGSFDYAGNAADDLPLWRSAREAIVVNGGRRIAGVLRRRPYPCRVFEEKRGGIRPWIQAMRVHQWLKNLLLFIPLLTSHEWHHSEQVGAVFLGFVAFSLCASAIYVFNDLMDLAADRAHPRKCRRPFAAGDLSLWAAGGLILLLLGGGAVVSAQLSVPFRCLLGLYLALTVSYSLHLKTVMMVDVLTLAGLYTLRVVAGSALLGIVPSFWLLAFSMFVFFSLALVKRCAELQALAARNGKWVRGRDYQRADLEPLYAMGVASGFLSVMVFAFFINSPEILENYRNPQALWFLCPGLLYWMGRLWLKTARGEMNEDPLVFSLGDAGSRYVVLLGVVLILLAQ